MILLIINVVSMLAWVTFVGDAKIFTFEELKCSCQIIDRTIASVFKSEKSDGEFELISHSKAEYKFWFYSSYVSTIYCLVMILFK